MSKCLFKFYWDCGRNGSLEGIFISTRDRVDALIGKNVYFGEVLGKHSEVQGIIKSEDIELLDIEPEAVEQLEAAIGCDLSGFNPLDYVED